MTGGEILIACLKAQGVRCLFGMPGTQNIGLYEAVRRQDVIRSVLIRNEQAATLMADGYARAGGDVGVALTVPGPGASNASTGLGEAYTDRSPVLLITGGVDTRFEGRDRGKMFHGLDQATFFKPITKYYACPQTVADIPEAVAGAFRAMRAYRPGPAVLEFPPDVVSAEGEASIPPRVEALSPSPSEADLRAALRALQAAARPVILAGGGILAAGASADLVRLAEALNAPVVTTRLGKGAIPEDHPLFLGHIRGRSGQQVVAQADATLAVGCRFTQIDTSGWTMQIPKPLIQIDADPEEIGKEYPADVGVAGDLRQALSQLTERLDPGVPRPGWASALSPIREGARNRPPLLVMDVLRQVLPRDAVVSVDVTTVGYRAFDEFPIYEPRTFLYPCHYVNLGYAFPAALGAKLARPDRAVVSVSGDGGFLMTAYELMTAVQYRIPVVAVVINDNCLSAIKGIQDKTYDGHAIDVEMQNPDYVRFAEAFGCRGLRASTPEALGSAVREAVQADGPTLIEVPLSPDQRDALIRRIPWIHPENQ
ncbi:MAG: thiamine pyrophosphate-binding protein [Candidatus Latescibacteria bacterium]|nr:thiamine pyrophosphate-binding protein [Candidatus Latescibacterota bacterium]